MKYLYIILLILIITSCTEGSRYEIRAGEKSYYTNSYSIDDNTCIHFKETCNCDGTNNTIICGTYVIKQLKK